MQAYHNSVELRNDGTDGVTGKEDLNAGVGVSVLVKIAGTGTNASLFDLDEVSTANPLTTDDNGNYSFKVTDGNYDIYIDGAIDAQLKSVSIFDVGAVIAPDRVIPFVTIAEAIASTDPLKIFDGAVLNVADDGNSNQYNYDVTLLSSVTVREDDIIACTGFPTLALVRRNKGTNEGYLTTEQLTKYTMTDNREIFGEEYLWGLHKQIILSTNTSEFKFVWSGDSTTFGVNATDASGAWPPSKVADFMSPLLGLAKSTHINAGHSSATGFDWGGFYAPQDITNHPDMNVYIVRWGINDGSDHGDVDKYITAMDLGLTNLRNFKDVRDLTIVVMSPNSTYNPDINRSTDWYEQITPRLRQICRKHQACFFDTYSIWQDAKQGVDTPTTYWMDDPFTNGQTVHPDGYMNHAIVKRVMDMLLKPVQRMGIPSNAFTNNFPRPFFKPLESSPPNFYSYGLHYYRVAFLDGWPFTGLVESQRNDQKVIQTIKNTIVDGGNSEQYKRIAVRYGDIGLNTWSKWYNVDVAPALLNGWATLNSRTPKYNHCEDGRVTIMGEIGSGTSGVACFNLPAEARPLVTRRFAVLNGSLGLSDVQILANGDVIPTTPNTVFLDGITFIAGS